jgi:hypothetical protein
MTSEGDTTHYYQATHALISLEDNQTTRVINFKKVHWTDVDVNEDGNARGVLGSEF